MLQYLYQPVCNHKKITKRKQNQKQNKQKSDKKTKKKPTRQHSYTDLYKLMV